MAADTISSLGGWAVSAVLHSGIVTNYFERPGLKSLCTNLGDGSGSGSLTFQIPTYSPGSDTFAAHTEAGAVTPDSLADGSYNVTLAQQVLDHKLSDEAMFIIDGSSWSNFVAQRAPWFAEQADNRISSMICDLFDDFTDVTGTAGDALTVDDMMVARAFMASLGGNGAAFAVLHYTQFAQLLTSMRAESMDGIFNPSVSALGGYGSVKGRLMGDTVIVETGLVGTVSSNYRGAMFRSDAFGYKHGVPQGLQTWAPGAQVMAVSPGDVAAWLAANGMSIPEPAMLGRVATLASNLMSNNAPAIYIETGRQGNIGTRETVIAASLFCGVGQQVARGTSIRSTAS